MNAAIALLAVAAAGWLGAGAGLAQPTISASVLAFAPRPWTTPLPKQPWAKPLTRHPRDPKPRKRPRATISLYETTTKQSTLRRQGCRAAKRAAGGVVILDFGKPAYNGHTYGTILFGRGRFAGNREITKGMLGFAVGYERCLPRGSDARIALARGTSNYHPAVPRAYQAGLRWARETRVLTALLKRHGLDEHVRSAAAIDAEPAWDPRFRTTHAFFHGFRDGSWGHLLYNFGSLDGGVGSIWNARQAFYVSGGMRYARMIPEIYNRAMAREWAYLAKLAQQRYRRPVRFAGVMTQHAPGCGCSLLPRKAHQALVRELAASVGDRAPYVPHTITNIRAAF